MAKRANPDPRASAIAASACALSGEAPRPDGNMTLWYRRPAGEWVEALPIGNGRLGAMVYGGVNREWLQLNEESVWTGRPIERDRDGAPEALAQARRLLFEGKYVEAQDVIQEKLMGLRIEKGLHTYQTLGDLELLFPRREEVADYRRELDLDEAVARVSYRADGATFKREAFASPVDEALVVRMTCDRPGMIDFEAKLSRPEAVTVEIVSPDRIVMSGQVRASESIPSEGIPSAQNGVRYETQLRIVAEGASVTGDRSALRVEGADAVTLILVAATSYWGDDPHAVCEQQIPAASGKAYDRLLCDHIADYQRLFRRVELDLGKTDAPCLPTNGRLEAVAAGAHDPQLIAQHFQFGRYLLISSSRPGGLPANLQGIWADGLEPPWNADYHININIQMNYWPAELCNLTECHEPFFEFTDALRERGRATAREVFGCRGFVSGHTTDAWLHGSIVGNTGYGMWPLGAAWCCQHLWERYAFGGDRELL